VLVHRDQPYLGKLPRVADLQAVPEAGRFHARLHCLRRLQISVYAYLHLLHACVCVTEMHEPTRVEVQVQVQVQVTCISSVAVN
jgi:hypothetical protein